MGGGGLSDPILENYPLIFRGITAGNPRKETKSHLVLRRLALTEIWKNFYPWFNYENFYEDEFRGVIEVTCGELLI